MGRHILEYEYSNLTLKNIKKETDMLLFILDDLKEYCYLGEKNIYSNTLLILNTIRYCYNNHCFVKFTISQFLIKGKNR